MVAIEGRLTSEGGGVLTLTGFRLGLRIILCRTLRSCGGSLGSFSKPGKGITKHMS